WRNASFAKDQAVKETKVSEARRVIAIARSLPDLDPSTKLAYAIRSLNFADNPEARSFAMQAIAEGPMYYAFDVNAGIGIQLSPDGKWLATGQDQGGMLLLSQDGLKPTVVNPKDCTGNAHVAWSPQFSPDSENLLWSWRKKLSVIKVWSVSQKKLARQFEFEGLTICLVRGGKAFFITDDSAELEKTPFVWRNCIIHSWNFGPDDPKVIGKVSGMEAGWKMLDIDSKGRWIAYPKGDAFYTQDFQHSGNPIMIGRGPSVSAQ